MTPDNRATRVRGARDNNLKVAKVLQDAGLVVTGFARYKVGA